jgi:ABC-type bacteriocin/lantibiotic exporter with double-glycine peptidase domain
LKKHQFISIAIAALGLLATVSCTSSSQLRGSGASVMPIEHKRGNEYSCLVDCIAMVLDYYDVRENALDSVRVPLKLIAVDSLLSDIRIVRKDGVYNVRSFVLQKDELFLAEQIQKQRPAILIFDGKENLYHGIVLSGMNARGTKYFVHDPAKKKANWISRKKLLKKWNSTNNTMLLIALAKNETNYSN